MQTPPHHPIEHPALRAAIPAALVLGIVFASADDPTSGFSALEIGATLSFACFLILFWVYLLGWLLREHELWREGRRQETK